MHTELIVIELLMVLKIHIGAKWLLTSGLSQPPFSHKLTYRQPVNRIHHHHLLFLLITKADTHFTIPRWVES